MICTLNVEMTKTLSTPSFPSIPNTNLMFPGDSLYTHLTTTFILRIFVLYKALTRFQSITNIRQTLYYKIISNLLIHSKLGNDFNLGFYILLLTSDNNKCTSLY